MHSSCQRAGIRRTLYKAPLIKWLLSSKNLELPIKYSQVRVLVLLLLGLYYALEEAAWPFFFLPPPGPFNNTSEMLSLVEC